MNNGGFRGNKMVVGLTFFFCAVYCLHELDSFLLCCFLLFVVLRYWSVLFWIVLFGLGLSVITSIVLSLVILISIFIVLVLVPVLLIFVVLVSLSSIVPLLIGSKIGALTISLSLLVGILLVNHFKIIL